MIIIIIIITIIIMNVLLSGEVCNAAEMHERKNRTNPHVLL